MFSLFDSLYPRSLTLSSYRSWRSVRPGVNPLSLHSQIDDLNFNVHVEPSVTLLRQLITRQDRVK